MIVSQISSPEEHFQWSGEEIGGGGDPFPICKNQLSHNGRGRLAPSAQGPGSITVYRGGNKGVFVLLSRTQAGTGRAVKEEQEEISRNHVHTFISPSVQCTLALEKQLKRTVKEGLIYYEL